MDARLKRNLTRPRPFLLVLSAPSGGGKTTVCARLLARLPWMRRCVTATTRPPRKGERDGRDYHFMSEARFRAGVRRGAFYEYAEVHGNLYGTPKAEVERLLRRGLSPVLVIDVQGGMAVRRMRRDAVLVFLVPPSLRALERRLRGRGTEAPAVLRRRLADARLELKAALKYDYLVVNDALEEAVDSVAAVCRAERLRNRK